VSVLLLLHGIAAGDDANSKGRAVLVDTGTFGVLCSLIALINDRVRARREDR